MITTTLLPPAPRGPRGPSPLVPIALMLASSILLTIMLPPMRPAHAAEVIGFRIAIAACLADRCREMPLPASLYAADSGCLAHAGSIATLAALHGPEHFGLPPGPWVFKGHCVPVFGDRRA